MSVPIANNGQGWPDRRGTARRSILTVHRQMAREEWRRDRLKRLRKSKS